MDENQPTEPLPPSGPQPVAAPHEPFYRRHGLAFAISTLVLGIVVLVGVLGAGTFVAVSVVGHSISALSHPHGFPMQAPPGDGSDRGTPGDRKDEGGGRGGGTQRELVRGTLESASGSLWRVTTSSGTTVTVSITDRTAFGRPAQPETASDFAAGDEVVVVGTDRSSDRITATRILKLSDIPRPPSTPGPTPGAGLP